MRNEGPFIVEWLCWYRMLGFTDAVVVTNNCTDHSPQLLDALQKARLVHHIRHDVEPGKRITRAKLQAAANHKSLRRADWLMICDVDEFLVIHRGEGLIGDLIDVTSSAPAYLGMSLNWRVFGTSGRKTFEDRPVHRQFTTAHAVTDRSSRFVKSIFRMPRYFSHLAEHTPRGFDFHRAEQKRGKSGGIWVNANGEKLPSWAPLKTHLTLMPQALVSHEVAQINHYMLRSVETYRLKRGTKSPVALGDRYRPRYFRNADAGREMDISAFRYSARFDALHEQVMAMPDVARLHALSCADHVRAIAEKAGKRAEDDPRYVRFMQRAEALADEALTTAAERLPPET
ncbi:MAG: glycosyltransferase family 2 protein [Cypionkella sp.]|nr:glycosyltransferase family 2 protein [Cypionkella sp.]